MKQIELKSFAKINLSLDVQGLLPSGYHKVEMIMQQILLCDDITVKWTADSAADGINVSLSTNRSYLPTDEKNLAYRAALCMSEKYSSIYDISGHVKIDIKKRIPVAAGLAGGSSNCASVIHALNKLWELSLPLSQLCSIGAELGSDVPFCIMGQAAANSNLSDDFEGDPLACHCALATGRGTDLKPVTGLKAHLVLSKPPISVSTADVYKGIDNEIIDRHPDNVALVKALEENNLSLVKKNMVNVLENFSLKRYPIIVYTKNKMQELCPADGVMMSGSGPAVFGICSDISQSKKICREMAKINKESFWTRTTW